MITLAIVLSLAAILKGVAWIVEGVCEWARFEPPQTWDDLDADFVAYAERRGREVMEARR